MSRNNTERSHLYMYVRKKLNPHADKVFAALLPGGDVQAGLYLCGGLRGGRGHSCIIDLESGLGYDTATQTCWGDYIDLGRQLWKCMAEESALRIMEMFGLAIGDFEQELATKKKHKLRSEIPEKEPIFPPPLISPPLPKNHPRLGQPLETWPYVNDQGRLLFYVAYFPAYSGKVKRICISLFRKINGRLHWYVGSQPSYQLYNLPQIRSAYSETSIMVVRRESYVHLVENLFPGVVGTTWSPGLRNLDVQPLWHRSVLIWPEASLYGCASAQILSEKLMNIGTYPSILNTSEVLPEGWDLGSPLPDGLSYYDLYCRLTPYIPIRFREMADARYPTLQRTIKSLGFRDVEFL